MTEPVYDGEKTMPVPDEKALTRGTVLVDTSLLIELQKRDKKAIPVREALSGFRFRGASSYSKLEFKRAWIQQFAYIHARCCQPNVESIADVVEYIERRLASPHQRRRVQTCLQALQSFLEMDRSGLSPRAELARLKAFCKTRVLEMTVALRESTTGEFKRTGCIRAEELPTEHSDGSLNATIHRCSPDKIQCRIHEFFSDNAATFDELAEAIESNDQASKELKVTLDHIRLAQQDATHLCNDRHCAKLADCIIAVDGKKMDVFAANNDKEWVTIAKTMSKPLLNPVIAKPD